MAISTRWLAICLCLIAAKPSVAEVAITPDVVYGHKLGLAMTFDVFTPEKPNGAGVLFMVSGGWYSRWAPRKTCNARLCP